MTTTRRTGERISRGFVRVADRPISLDEAIARLRSPAAAPATVTPPSDSYGPTMRQVQESFRATVRRTP